jgi:hypothetical protein
MAIYPSDIRRVSVGSQPPTDAIELHKNGVKVGTVGPNAGAKYTAQDGDKWTAKMEGGSTSSSTSTSTSSLAEEQQAVVVRRWTTNVARGIVQDVVLMPHDASK